MPISRSQDCQSMLHDIQRTVYDTAEEIGKSQFDKTVMSAIARVPREEFVPDEQRSYAYRNSPLPIGHQQTISQPYIVALMTDLLEAQANDNILEIGTGSGYQAAVLANIVSTVFSIEIVDALLKQAQQRFRKLEINNIYCQQGDGYCGWPEHAPFDGIIVTAASPHIPPPLIEQLKVGGRLVIPVGGEMFTQHLLLVQKKAEQQLESKRVLPVRFVPLTGNLGAQH